jgi:hypothetical protein
MLLSLPIPASMDIDLQFTAVPRNKGQFLRYGLTISKFATLAKLYDEISVITGVPTSSTVLTSV